MDTGTSAGRSSRSLNEDGRQERRRWTIIAGLLLLVAVVIVWHTISRARQEAALNKGELYTRPVIASRIGRTPPGPMTPFENLDLTSDQRQKIQQIMTESMSEAKPGEPSPGPGTTAGQGAPGPEGVAPASGPHLLIKLQTADGPGAAPGGAPGAGQSMKDVTFHIPMDKIRAILTPEQQQKLDVQAPAGGRHLFLRPGPQTP